VREAAIDPSSSQVAGPAFDGFFSDALDNGDGFGLELGDDLARELGWAVSPVKSVRGNDRSALCPYMRRHLMESLPEIPT